MHPSQINLPEFVDTDAEACARLDLNGKIQRAITLLKKHEPEAGYFLAFSGGKDSCVIKELAKLSGVKFDAWYSQTTIDPPELVRFIKQQHADVGWIIPKHGHMMKRLESVPGGPPTRSQRWCCAEYKENCGAHRVCIFGVRSAESAARKKRWTEATKTTGHGIAICPIVHWSDANVWEFIRSRNIPYCSLYDEGMKRLGCVGCPMSPKSRSESFVRWPKFETNWRNAIVKNWENFHDKLNLKGKPRFQSSFKSGEEFWQWWMQEKSPDVMRGDCQQGMLWTNESGINENEL
jgi:phosphoadenosine phosphosulfate reductase